MHTPLSVEKSQIRNSFKSFRCSTEPIANGQQSGSLEKKLLVRPTLLTHKVQVMTKDKRQRLWRVVNVAGDIAQRRRWRDEYSTEYYVDMALDWRLNETVA